MAASRYRKFLQLIEQWPVNPSMKGRDLGTHIRETVTNAFQKGATSQVDERKCDEMHQSLQRLVDDHHRNQYPRFYQSTATGSTLEQCRLVTSKDTDELQYIVKRGREKEDER